MRKVKKWLSKVIFSGRFTIEDLEFINISITNGELILLVIIDILGIILVIRQILKVW